MRLSAEAKVNIGLIVGDRRADGYHDIETIMARISLADIIEAEIEQSSSFSVSIKGNDSYLSASATDLMERAARFFYEITGFPFALSLRVEKHIPVMAGLGGGSSDAAAVLTYLNRQFGFPIDKKHLAELSVSVGSDVPFFVSGYSGALVKGRGESVSECYVPHGKRIYIRIGEEGINTAKAYAELDKIPRKQRHLSEIRAFPTRELFPNDFELVSSLTHKDVFPSVFTADGAYVSLTGSGSAWFSIFPDDEAHKFDNLEKCAIVSAYII